MKIGAKRMRYPDNDPENGPAYMQQWTGEEWVCLHHKAVWNSEDRIAECKNCGMMLMTNKEVEAVVAKSRK